MEMKLKTYQHFPTLKTILLVETTLKKHKGDLMSKAQIDRLLGGRINRSTLNIILDYLEDSGKILQGNEGILWTFMGKEKLNKLLKKGLIV